MTDKYSDAEIQSALKAGDVAGLARMLEDGLDPGWTGPGGNTLLHGAARLGDTSLVDKLFERGARALVRNAEGETPWDTAIAWGRDAAAEKITARLADERLTAAPGPLACPSLAELRRENLATGVNQFHALAKQGRFAQVVALAEKDPQGLKAAELLARGPDGDSALMKICQHGQLPLLVKPGLWVKEPQEFQSLWENVPSHYRKEVDYDSFIGQLRQMKLKSYGNVKLKGFKK